MKKTNNFLNNQRYIGSEKIKKIIYLKYKKNSYNGLSIIRILFYLIIMYIWFINTILNFKMDLIFVLIISWYWSVWLTYLLFVEIFENFNNNFITKKYDSLNYYLKPNILEKITKLWKWEIISNNFYEITKK